MLTLEIHDSELRARLTALPGAIRQSIRRGVYGFAIDMVKWVQEKLSGQVLNERTHHLHDSIHWAPSEDTTGVFATVGTNLPYGFVHEYGGTFDIREHLRRLTMVFGRPVTPRDVLVRAHKATYPERSYLRSTLHEHEDELSPRLQAAVSEGVKE